MTQSRDSEPEFDTMRRTGPVRMPGLKIALNLIGTAVVGMSLVILGSATLKNFQSQPSSEPAQGTLEMFLSYGLVFLFGLAPILAGGWVIFRSLKGLEQQGSKSSRKSES